MKGGDDFIYHPIIKILQKNSIIIKHHQNNSSNRKIKCRKKKKTNLKLITGKRSCHLSEKEKVTETIDHHPPHTQNKNKNTILKITTSESEISLCIN